ncbi:MAG: septum formation protein Maf [Kordiimonas sp.]|nr:septum formation protein Maf [Kordiimonas sp.]
MADERSTLILASASKSRRRILKNAGIDFRAIAADFDETTAKNLFLQTEDKKDFSDLALKLAEGKAQSVSGDYPDAVVIGADQLLVCGGELYSKPINMDAARQHLLSLRGRAHQLVTAYVIVKNGQLLSRHVEMPTLQMRAFSDDFLDTYLHVSDEDILSSVGAYLLEGLGAQLFDHINGDYFSILGLPIWSLLTDLREQGVIKE